MRSALPLSFVFVTDKNFEECYEKVYLYLENDYYEQGCPQGHFYHNIEDFTISLAFQESRAMIVLNEQDELVGYLTWKKSKQFFLTIEIVEVVQSHREEGVFTSMLAQLKERFPDLYAFQLSAISESRSVFENATHWQFDRKDDAGGAFFLKRVMPDWHLLPPHSELPDGPVMGFCRRSYYEIRGNTDNEKFDYYRIKIRKDGVLEHPIALDFDMEWYIGLFYDQQLIAAERVDRLFSLSAGIEFGRAKSQRFVFGQLEAASPLQSEVYKKVEKWLNLAKQLDRSVHQVAGALTTRPTLLGSQRTPQGEDAAADLSQLAP